MATKSLEAGHYSKGEHQPHTHDHHHDPKTNTYRERLRQAANRTRTPEEIVGKPAAACFQNNDLTRLLALPTHSYSAIKTAFNAKPCLVSRSRNWSPPANLDPLPKPTLGTSITTTTQQGNTGTHKKSAAAPGINSKLDSHFRVGFSMAYGHSIELNMEAQAIKDGSPLDSGTYIFDRDEMPYASVIDREWRGKLCVECLRTLPSLVGGAKRGGGGFELKVLECGSCPRSTGSTDSEGKELGPAKFCSQTCLEQAWRTWHGYECKFAGELDQFEQDTRLALRIFWRNCHEGVRLVSGDSAESPFSNIDTLTSAASGLSLNANSNSIDAANRKPRVRSKDGAQISILDLYHNFDRLAPKTQMAFLVKAHYLQELMGLPKNAARELAQIQALVQFNSFAIKSKASEAKDEGSLPIDHLKDFSVGSGVYLLASMFNHSCAPNAMVVFGGQAKASLRDGQVSSAGGGGENVKDIDPRVLNVLTSKVLKAYGSVPAQVEISYGPTGGRMATEERKECLQQMYLFECNCSACNDRYAETFRRRVFKCQKNGYSCRPMLEDEEECPTCGEKVDYNARNKMMKLIAQLLGETSNPTLPLSRRLTLLKTLEVSQARLFVDTYTIYGHVCDQLAMVYTQSGDLGQAVQWCRKALKVVMVNFPHDSIEVAQETLKLAGLLFNNQQHKEALKHVQTAIVLYRGHYGAESKHPDLLELYQMEGFLKPIVNAS
ncbi:SET and MYND domain-containing protein 4 [Mortierella sp. 14UC]|nr:SET and MYND domain-containing protein 4 [Mortierella sp. 14UC]